MTLPPTKIVDRGFHPAERIGPQLNQLSQPGPNPFSHTEAPRH